MKINVGVEKAGPYPTDYELGQFHAMLLIDKTDITLDEMLDRWRDNTDAFNDYWSGFYRSICYYWPEVLENG